MILLLTFTPESCSEEPVYVRRSGIAMDEVSGANLTAELIEPNRRRMKIVAIISLNSCADIPNDRSYPIRSDPMRSDRFYPIRSDLVSRFGLPNWSPDLVSSARYDG